jgi:predicted RNase H-like HicB family nuclease
MTIYAALLRKDPNSAYSVDFPDFPGSRKGIVRLGRV